MSDVRLRRLRSDYDAVRRLVRLHPRIAIEGVSGNPPDRYRFVLRVRSLRQKGEDVELVDRHRIEVRLPLGYPRDPPVCRMLTPVFHPNIAPHVVCVGDHWTAAESLDALVQRVGEMLAFQSYNIKSPLNGQAARWVEENVGRLPVDRTEFFVDLADAEEAVRKSSEEIRRCSNCGTLAERVETCPAGHVLCGDCAVHCPRCGGLMCIGCGPPRCERCSGPSCSNCGGDGATAYACAGGHRLCPDCAVTCPRCGGMLCLACGQPPCPACGAAGASG